MRPTIFPLVLVLIPTLAAGSNSSLGEFLIDRAASMNITEVSIRLQFDLNESCEITDIRITDPTDRKYFVSEVIDRYIPLHVGPYDSDYSMRIEGAEEGNPQMIRRVVRRYRTSNGYIVCHLENGRTVLLEHESSNHATRKRSDGITFDHMQRITFLDDG